LPPGAKHIATKSCTLSKGVASDHLAVWLLVEAKAKADLALQQMVEKNEIEISCQSIGNVNASVLAATGLNLHNNTQILCPKYLL